MNEPSNRLPDRDWLDNYALEMAHAHPAKQQDAMGKDYGLNCGDYAAAQEAMGKDVPEWLPRLKDDTQALKYRVNNPSAWEAYSEEGSEQLRRAVRLLEEVIAAHEQPPVDPIDRLRDAIEALHGIHFDRDKMEQIVRRAGIDSLAAAGGGE